MKFNHYMKYIIFDFGENFFFRRNKTSPRYAILNYMPDYPVAILDLCTGTGRTSINIARQKPLATVTGIDISKERLDIANQKIAAEQLNNIKTILMNAMHLNFDDNSFHIVIISLVLHELNDSLSRKILSEAKRVLKPGGKIILVEWEEPKKYIDRFLFQFIRFIEPKIFSQFLTMDLIEFLKSNGLAVNQIQHCNYTCIYELSCI